MPKAGRCEVYEFVSVGGVRVFGARYNQEARRNRGKDMLEVEAGCDTPPNGGIRRAAVSAGRRVLAAAADATCCASAGAACDSA